MDLRPLADSTEFTVVVTGRELLPAGQALAKVGVRELAETCISNANAYYSLLSDAEHFQALGGKALASITTAVEIPSEHAEALQIGLEAVTKQLEQSTSLGMIIHDLRKWRDVRSELKLVRGMSKQLRADS